MLVLRQLSVTTVQGTATDQVASQDDVTQVTDPNPRYILRLAGPGMYAGDTIALAASGTYAIPLPPDYVTTNNLQVLMVSSLTVKLAVVSSTNGSSTMLIRAGLASDQGGVASFCGPVTSMTLTNPQSTTATIQWFLFQMPDIDSADGWRDGSLSTGVLP